MLSWLNASEAKKFGVSLGHLVIERNPLVGPDIKDKLMAKKQEALLNKLSQEVTRFKGEHTLNVYKKAQLGNAFKWTLKEAGYDPVYLDQLTTWLMLKF